MYANSLKDDPYGKLALADSYLIAEMEDEAYPLFDNLFNEYSSDIKILNKLESKRMFWAPKLIALSEITPERMSITGFEYDHKRLKISAISSVDKTQKDFDIVEDFMNRISENKEFNNDFKDIKFESMEKSNAKGNDVLSFTIEARLK